MNFPFSKVHRIYRRRYMLRQCGLEIVMSDDTSVLFSFRSSDQRNEIYNLLIQQPDVTHRRNVFGPVEMIARWQARQISNYDYLMYLNHEADRTCNDLTQVLYCNNYISVPPL